MQKKPCKPYMSRLLQTIATYSYHP